MGRVKNYYFDEINRQANEEDGMWECEACQGKGKIDGTSCEVCNGDGFLTSTAALGQPD